MWSGVLRRGVMALRLVGVEGTNRLINDLIYCAPLQRCTPASDQQSCSTVIFFPGDVQNYPEMMKNDAENAVYLKWNLIAMALRLQSHYKSAHIVVVKPSRVEFNVYSCYDNFLRCDKFGAPQKGSYVQAVPNLEALLNNAAIRVSCESEQNNKASPGRSENGNVLFNLNDKWRPEETNIILIAFSKGCVVLNQLLYEICDGAEGRFLKSRITGVNWLDGGHGGSSGAWITQTDVLSTMSSFPWELCVEVTPYQVERREWVKCEEKIFSETLLRNRANLKRRLHFASSPPSLLNHFRILDILYPDT